ncbi:MAG: oxidoreductase [Oscillospiraceae bacterium]|nr:oxidoreductase [Oscillospiraceae bacterium]
MYQIFFDELNTKMYPSTLLHRFGVNGKISGSIGASGEIASNVYVMIHGGVGCAYHYRNSARRRHQPFFNILSSDLTQSEIVYGGLDKLEKEARKAWERYRPDLLILVPTPVSDVLNEDLIDIAQRMRDEGMRVVAVKSELFSHRDKNYAKIRAKELAAMPFGSGDDLEIELRGCGFSELLYALVDQLMEPCEAVPYSVNIETVGWGSEGKAVLREIEAFLGECGVKVNTWLPSASVESLTKAPAASLNIVKRIHWARLMRDRFGTPYLHINDSGRYEGLSGICEFYRDIGKKLGREDIFEEAIGRRLSRTSRRCESILAKLSGYTATLICRGFQTAPYRIMHYAEDCRLNIKSIVIIVNDDMRRDVDMTEQMEQQFMDKIYSACEKYAPGASVSVNPSSSEMDAIFSGCDAVVGSNDFRYEGHGAGLIPDSTDMTGLSFESYERNLARLAERLERSSPKDELIINRFDYSPDEFTMLGNVSHTASKEMWKLMWLEKEAEI